MCVRFTLGLFVALACAPVFGAELSTPPDPYGWDTVYIRDSGATPIRQTLGLRIDTDGEVEIPSEIDFRCTILSPADYDSVSLRLEIEPETGPVLYRGELEMDLVTGEQAAVLRWPAPAELEDGDYRVLISAERPNGAHMASMELSLRKLSYQRVADAVAGAETSLTALDDHIAALGTETFTPAVLHRLAIARETAQRVQEAWDDERWSAAYDLALEALDASNAVRAGLTFAALTPERFARTPEIAPRELSIRGGAVESASGPVFLFGVRLPLAQSGHIPALARFGLNAVVIELAPADVLPDAQTVMNLDDTLGPLLDACADAHMAVALQLEPQRMAGWALDRWPDMARSQFAPFYYDVTHPRALDVLEKFYGAVGEYANREPRIAAVSIADAPRFRISDEPMRQGFAVHLASYYASTDAMNLSWQTRLRSIEEIPIRWDWEKPSYQAHLQRYHRDQVTGFFAWIANALGPNTRNVPILFTAPGSAFAIGGAKDGIDLEGLGGTFSASGIESPLDGPPSAYAIAHPDSQMRYDLLRSLNPLKPVFDFGGTVGGDHASDDSYPYAERARLWQAAIAGADAFIAPFGALFDTDGGEIQPHNTRDLAGFISGGETLNRLAETVQAFQNQPAPVAVLWSDSSRTLDNGTPYLPSLRRACEGAASYGLPVRFISERQIAAGELDTVTILMLPEVWAISDAAFEPLDRFIADGGRLVSTGSSIPYDEFGQSRSRLQVSPLTKLVRGGANAGNYLRALDAAVEASALEEVPRAIDDRGYPILGVVSRYLPGESGGHLYLVNLRREAEMVYVPDGHLEGRDLIDGRPVQFPLQLEPLDPMLIALSPREPDEIDAVATETGTPTAIVESVIEDES